MSKSSVASAPKLPTPLSQKSAWARGPPISSTAPTPRSQSPAQASGSQPSTASHSRRPSTLSQAPVSFKDGVAGARSPVGATKSGAYASTCAALDRKRLWLSIGWWRGCGHQHLGENSWVRSHSRPPHLAAEQAKRTHRNIGDVMSTRCTAAKPPGFGAPIFFWLRFHCYELMLTVLLSHRFLSDLRLNR